MEICRGIVKRINVDGTESRRELFQEGCYQLACSLFGLLRPNDPWPICIEAYFEGPLPLDPNSPDFPATLFADRRDITSGIRAPYVDYWRFEMESRDKGLPLQRVTLSKDYDEKYNSGEFTWELEIQTVRPVDDWLVKHKSEDPVIVAKILRSLQKWKSTTQRR